MKREHELLSAHIDILSLYCSLSAPLLGAFDLWPRGPCESEATPGHMPLLSLYKLSAGMRAALYPPVPTVELWMCILDKYRFDLWRVSNGSAPLLIQTNEYAM